MQKSSKLILGLVFSTAIFLGTGVALVIDIFLNAPDFTVLRTKVTYNVERSDKTWAKRQTGPQTGNWTPLKEISNPVIMAVIASEDTSFFSHSGVDFHELKEAVKKDWEEKRWARGGSTITQQVIKNVFLNRQKTIWRKLKEFFWAQRIEKVLSKSEILAFYLNMAEWGPNFYGIKEAAEHYFNVPPSMLTAKQAAYLAMLLPAPKKYYTYFKRKEITPWAQSRIDQILRVMNRMNFIDETTYNEALQEALWGVTGVSKGKEADPSSSEDPGIPEEETAPVKPVVKSTEKILTPIKEEPKEEESAVEPEEESIE